MIRVVTTCNAEGWQLYGRRMAQSFVAQWPREIQLALYAEGFACDVEGVEVRQLPQWQADFKAQYASVPDAVGMGKGDYAFKRDCVRFSHKVGAIVDAGERQSEGLLIWIDADTFTHSGIAVSWVKALFPGRGYVAWLDRVKPVYPECGFLMFRCDHSQHAEMMRRLRHTYASGDVLKMHETHDSFVVYQLFTEAHKAGLIEAPFSLSGSARTLHHPFVACELGRRMDHMKGKRKLAGRSRTSEARRNIAEAYWKQQP